MVVNTDTTLALCCPDCGRLGLHVVSRFIFCREKRREIKCSCKTLLAVIATRDHKRFWLEINCIVCEATHLYRLTAKELWPREIIHLSCQETGLELGQIGPRAKIKEYLKGQQTALETLVEEMGGQTYFKNAEIMLSALSFVHSLAEDGNLCCPCGRNQIELEIFPDRIELHCRHCKRVKVVKAESEQDALSLQALKKIELSWCTLPDVPEHAFRKHDNK
ncbi:hypothetical protein [Desulforudis sp. DRI-14]|uniref:hypothetical protein n=1 Tax=Desulforudis sp. DRI-14 TaxID=3459793 RepID=UPI004042C877